MEEIKQEKQEIKQEKQENNIKNDNLTNTITISIDEYRQLILNNKSYNVNSTNNINDDGVYKIVERNKKEEKTENKKRDIF